MSRGRCGLSWQTHARAKGRGIEGEEKRARVEVNTGDLRGWEGGGRKYLAASFCFHHLRPLPPFAPSIPLRLPSFVLFPLALTPLPPASPHTPFTSVLCFLNGTSSGLVWKALRKSRSRAAGLSATPRCAPTACASLDRHTGQHRSTAGGGGGGVAGRALASPPPLSPTPPPLSPAPLPLPGVPAPGLKAAAGASSGGRMAQA